MKTLTLTTADKLKTGDTFYKERDPHKITYTVLPLKCRTPGKRFVQKGELKFTDIVDINAAIIFLKHKHPLSGVTIKKVTI